MNQLNKEYLNLLLKSGVHTFQNDSPILAVFAPRCLIIYYLFPVNVPPNVFSILLQHLQVVEVVG